MTATAPVTVLGLGLMGQALAAAFLDRGHPTTVWNRTPGRADALVAAGAVEAGSVQEAAGPLVVICVSDYDAVRELLAPATAALTGSVVVNLSTGTSAQARETAAWASGNGLRYLDGAIMAIPPVIGTAGAVLLHSGPRDAFAEHEATLQTLAPGGTTYLGADHGRSALHDMALLGLMWGILNGFLHGAALLGTAGVEATAFAPLANRMIKEVTEYVTAYAPQVDDGKYPATDATLTVHRDALTHLAEESEAAGIDAGLPHFHRTLVDRAAASRPDDSYAALIEVFRAPTAA